MDQQALDSLAQQLEVLGCTPGIPLEDPLAAFGPELALWASYVGTADVAIEEGKLRPPLAETIGTLLARDDDGNQVARFRALFAGLSLVIEDDEEAVLASWVPLASGSAQTYRVQQDELGLAKGPPSLGGALCVGMATPDAGLVATYKAFDKDARKMKFPAALDPATLWKASEWLVDVFLDISTRGLDAQLKAALPYKAWGEHKALLADWPQLAHSWLLTHWAFGNDEELTEALALTAELGHPVTRELRAFVSGQDPWPQAAALGQQRATLQALAPASVLSPKAKQRKKAVEKELQSESPEVAAARAELQADAAAKPALERFAELMALSAKDPWSSEVFQRRPQAVREFAEAVDARWLPILQHHQRLAARYIDTHKAALPGLVLALAKLSPDYATFRQHVDRFGVGAFGIQRRQELAVAVGEFIEDKAALAWLVAEARPWAEQIEKWDVPVSPAFEQVLLRHPLAESFALIERVLSAKQFHGGNWRICVATAIAVGELDGKLVPPTVVEALRKALDRGLGREDNGERAAIAKALERLGG